MNWATYSCKAASEMIEKRAVTKLSYTEQIKLTIHTSMCKTCKTYAIESKWIDESMHQHIKEQAVKTSELSSNFKTNLIQNIKDLSE